LAVYASQAKKPDSANKLYHLVRLVPLASPEAIFSKYLFNGKGRE